MPADDDMTSMPLARRTWRGKPILDSQLEAPTVMSFTAHPPRREQWVDAARGVVIVLVVAHHATTAMQSAAYYVQPIWLSLDTFLNNVRMPIFFVLAGLFARRALRLTVYQYWRQKVARLVWLLGLWSFLRVALYAADAAVFGRPVLEVAQHHAAKVLTLDSPLWFIAALSVCFMLLWATRSIPAWLVVASLTVVSIATSFANFQGTWVGVLNCPVWFFLGGYLSKNILSAAKHVRLHRAARLPAAAPAVWLGRHTLPVYLLHPVVLATLWPLPEVRHVLLKSGLAAPALLAAVFLVLSVAVWAVTRRVPGLYGLGDAPADGKRSKPDDQ